jgi:predicted GIY-YIG superfamily endonuclease
VRRPEVDAWCVYRVYDRDGNLLYIGQTCKRKRRMRLHRQRSRWWPEDYSPRVEFQECESYWDSMIVEGRAILAENPIHNKERPSAETIDGWELATT